MEKNQNEKKVNYSQNLGIVEQEAKKSFLELVDEIKSAKADKREIKLLSSKKAKIFEFYLIFLKEIEKTKFYSLILYVAIVIWLNYDVGIFKITDNYTLDTALQSIVLFLFFSFSLIWFQSQNNIESFFLKLYPQMETEKRAGMIASILRDFIFNKNQRKEHGFKKVFYILIALVLINAYFVVSGKYLNLNILGVIAFVVFLMAQPKQNNVLKMI